MKPNYLNKFLILSSIILMSVSCKVITQKYQSPKTQTEHIFRDADTKDTTNIANLSWKEVFTDSLLQNLISDAIAKNSDLQIAYSRIKQSQAYFEQSKAAFLPTFAANANITKSNASSVPSEANIGNYINVFQLGVTAGWEVDILGKLSSNKKAVLASMLQTEDAAKAIQTSIVSNVANYYYKLLALDKQLNITQESVRNWDTTVQTMKLLKTAAIVTEAAVVQSEAQRYAAEITIPDLKRLTRETENALCILIGNPPAKIRRSSLENQNEIEILSIGVPSQLLSNRPDVRQAENAYRQAFELTNVSRAAFYPSLNITATAGLGNTSLSNFFNPAILMSSISAGLTQPIFNRKLNKTNLAVAQEQQQIALITFRNKLLLAGREVSDAMDLHYAAIEKMKIRSKQLESLTKSVDYTQELLRNGFANYVEVISARQNLLSAELGKINDKLQELQASVNLYRSLGGGWK